VIPFFLSFFRFVVLPSLCHEDSFAEINRLSCI